MTNAAEVPPDGTENPRTQPKPILTMTEIASDAKTPASNSERVAKNTGFYLVAQILSWASTFIGMSVFARVFSTDLVGKLVIADTIRLTVVTYLSFSMENYLVKEIGRNPRNMGFYVNAMLSFRLLILVPTLLVVVFWFSLLKPDPVLWMLGAFYLLWIPLNYFTGIVGAVLSGREEGKRSLYLGILQSCLTLASLFSLKFGLLTYLCVGTTFQFVIAGIYYRWLRSEMPLKPYWSPPLWQKLIRGSVPFFVNNVLLQTYGAITVFTLRHFLDNGSVAVYYQASRLTGTLLFFPTALGVALLPSLTRLAEGSPEQIRGVQARVFSLLIILGVPMMLLTIGLAYPLCHLIYGNTKWEAVPGTLQIYAVALLPLYIVSTMYQFLIAKGKNGLWIWFLIASIGVNVACNWVLIPWTQAHLNNGVIGAAISTVIAESLSAVCAIWLLGEGIFTRESVGRLLRTAVAGGLMAGTLYLTHKMLLLIPLISGVGVYLLAGWKLKILEPEEETKLNHYVHKFLPHARQAA